MIIEWFKKKPKKIMKKGQVLTWVKKKTRSFMGPLRWSIYLISLSFSLEPKKKQRIIGFNLMQIGTHTKEKKMGVLLLGL